MLVDLSLGLVVLLLFLLFDFEDVALHRSDVDVLHIDLVVEIVLRLLDRSRGDSKKVCSF